MKFERGPYYAGEYTAYRFTKGEVDLIAQALKSFIPKIEKKITRVENHPRNEGQATYAVKIMEHQGDIAFCKEMIEEAARRQKIEED
jgi:methionyl-tRNA formyltransferase